MGRLLRVALAGIALALVLAASGQTFPTDAENPNTGATDRHILATCPVGHTCIDLAVSQGDSPDPVPAGNLLTYQIVVQNHGPNDATAVTMTDSLPAGIDTNPASVLITGDPACAPPSGGYNPLSNTVTCFYPTLENTDLKRTARHITIAVRYSPTNPPPYPKTIVNNIHIGDDCGCDELAPLSNDSHENTQVTSPGDLKLTKWHSTTEPVSYGHAGTAPSVPDPAGRPDLVRQPDAGEHGRGGHPRSCDAHLAVRAPVHRHGLAAGRVPVRGLGRGEQLHRHEHV